MKIILRVITSASFLLLASFASHAALVNFEIVEIESPTFDGRSFGDVGQYEMITARATIAVDPTHRLNAGIVDIDLAPTNDDGLVEATADVAILRPVDLSEGSGRLFYEVLNRGDKISFILMNDAPWVRYYHGLDAGNGHLMNEGYTIVWSGWQGDMPPGENRMRLQAPVIEGLTGVVRDEIIFYHDYNPFVATLSYPAASLDTESATLTVRARQTDSRVTPDDMRFEFFEAPELRPTRIDKLSFTGPRVSMPVRSMNSSTRPATRSSWDSRSPPYVTSFHSCVTTPRMRTGTPTRSWSMESLPLTMRMAMASRRAGASCGISCIRASTRTSGDAWCSTA